MNLVRIAWFLALAWAGAGCTGGGNAAPGGDTPRASAPALLVSGKEIAVVRALRLESGVSFTGELVPQTTTRMVARFDGDLERVLIREGQRVRRGQALAHYSPRDITDLLQAAEAEVSAAQAAVLAAEAQEARAEKLLAAGAAAPMDLEAAQAARAASHARLRAAEAARNTARDSVERLDVPSPIDGWASEVIVHDGDRTAVGDPLMTLVNTDTLELSATLPAELLSRVRPGGLLRFTLDAFPGQDFQGVIDRLSPTTEPGTRQIRVYARIPNPDGKLVGGLFAGGRIVTAAKEGALAVPVAALRKEGAETVVYRLREGTTRRVAVEIGLSDEGNGLVELLGEVSAGDSLLTGVLPGIRDGVPVRLLGTP